MGKKSSDPKIRRNLFNIAAERMGLNPSLKHPVVRIIFALIIPFLALGAQWLLWAYFKPYVWFLFFPTAFFSAWIGGLIGGIAATLISTMLVWYFFIPPSLAWVGKDLAAGYSVVVFVIMGSLFALLHDRLRHLMRRTDDALAAAESAKDKISTLYKKMQELDEQKSLFFANVSHELRTPLTLILAPLERRLNLLTGMDSPLDERRETEIMLRNARLLYRHVTDLLDVAKLDAGRMSLTLSHNDLALLVRAMASHFDSLAKERRIGYTVTTPEAFPTGIDGEKMQRILLNLLSNAFKFTPDGGAIAVHLSQAGNEALIEVQDNGPGVPAELREVVFERFRQGEGHARRSHGGTGLGLSIVKDFVELHGGSTRLGEAPGGGALFSVRIPLRPLDSATPGDVRSIDEEISKQALEELEVRPPMLSRDSSGITADERPLVLVVEDNADMNEFIASTLQPYYRVNSAFNGREGANKALALQPALILTDLMMPVMSGDEMVTELRRQPGTRDVPIIMLTAKAEDRTRLRLLQEGVQDYLNKPFSTEELLARVAGQIKTRQRTIAELSRSAERLRHLAEVVEKITAVHDLPKLLAVVRHAARELTGADGATLVLRDNGYCHYVDEDAIAPLWKGQRFPLESCISGWAMLHAEALAIEDIYVDPRIPHAAYLPTFVKSLSMAPIGREEPAGAIGCYWATRHQATTEELELQQALADAISVGLVNIKLYRGLENARHAAEQSAITAQESEKRFRRLFHEAPVALCFISKDGVLTDFNQRFGKMFGYAHTDALTLEEWYALAYPDPVYRARICESWNTALAQAAVTGNDIDPIECQVHSNGKHRTVLASGIMLGEDLLATFFDVTERKQAEEALRQQAEELKRRNDELERFSQASTGREIEMIKLKQQVNALSRQLGLEPPYPLTFLEPPEPAGDSEQS